MSLLAPYDPSWASRFELIAAELRAHGDPDWVIEHIGSTAIVGMAAKPVIDVAVRVLDEAEFARHRPALERLGWRVGSGVRSHPVMIFTENGARTRIAHFFAAREWDAVNQRILRDWLRAQPADAARYEQVKRDAAHAAEQGRARYNAAKTGIIQEILVRARTARGLPLVDAYDK